MNQKTINLIITIIFFSLIAGVAFALDYIQLNPQANEPPVVCDANREGSIYYGFPGNAVYVCDSTQNWSSMGATGNISPLTVTTTDGLLYLNTGLTDHLEGDIYLADQIYGYNDLRLGGDSDFSGETDQFSDLFINAVGDVSIPNGSLTVTDLSDCDQIKTTSGLLDCGTDADTWQQNTDAQEGYVLAGGTNNNRVWKTDGSGVPSWQVDATAGTISGTAGQVAFFNSGTSITSDTGLSWDNTNKKLDVNSPSGSAGDVNTGSAGFYSYNTASRYLRFNTNGSYNDLLSYGAPLTINHSGEQDIFMNVGGGNVGIGTASPSSPPQYIPASKLLVAGNTAAYSAIGTGDNVRTGIAHYDDTAMTAGAGGQLVLGYKYCGSNYTEGAIIKTYKENSTDCQYGSGLKFQVRNHAENLATQMVLNPSGNVGIGTTAPGKKLEVVGDIISVDGAGSGVDAIAITGSGTGGSIWAADSYNPASPTSGWAEMIRLAQNTGSVILPQGRNFYIGESARFVSDSGYLHYYGPRPFYIRDEVPTTYIYSANTYLGSSSGDTIHLRSNIMKGTSWYMESDGLRLGSASSPGSWELYVDGQTYVSDKLIVDGKIGIGIIGPATGLHVASFGGTYTCVGSPWSCLNYLWDYGQCVNHGCSWYGECVGSPNSCSSYPPNSSCNNGCYLQEVPGTDLSAIFEASAIFEGDINVTGTIHGSLGRASCAWTGWFLMNAEMICPTGRYQAGYQKAELIAGRLYCCTP